MCEDSVETGLKEQVVRAKEREWCVVGVETRIRCTKATDVVDGEVAKKTEKKGVEVVEEREQGPQEKWQRLCLARSSRLQFLFCQDSKPDAEEGAKQPCHT